MYNSQIHHRRTIRIKDYDYSKSGMYFITICSYCKKYIFGNIKNEKTVLSSNGTIAEKILLKLQNNLKEKISIIEYVIMPNHVHFIVEFKEDYKIKLRDFITLYKTLVTKNIKKNRTIDYVWQRNYYEHVVRNEKELYAIIEYIQMNPARWESDSMYLC